MDVVDLCCGFVERRIRGGFEDQRIGCGLAESWSGLVDVSGSVDLRISGRLNSYRVQS